VQPDIALAWLARRFPVGGGLDPVVYRVPDQMQQRIGQPVEDTAVQLCVGAAYFPLDFLALGAGNIANRPVKPVGDRGHRHHPGPHGAVLQVVQGQGKLVELGAGGRVDLEPILELSTLIDSIPGDLNQETKSWESI
jgi:hypothetical protein